MDETRTEALSEHLFKDMVGGMSLLALFIGHRLELFKEMAESGPVTVSELARRTRLSKRYVRERLFAVASPEYVEVDAHGKRFKLTLSQSGHELPGGRTAHSTANRTRENAPHRRCGPQPVFRPALQITRKISQNVK